MPKRPTEPPRPAARTSRSSFRRHLLLSAVLWITYALYWRIVLARGVAREAPLSLALLAVVVLLQFGLTQAWVAHNRRLARRLEGRRRRRPPGRRAGTHDFLGRRIRVPGGVDLHRADRIVVRVEGGEKRFLSEPLRSGEIRGRAGE